MRAYIKFYHPKKKDMTMKCVKVLSIAVALFGITVMSSAQTLQDVADAYNKAGELLSKGDLDGVITEMEKCVELAKKVGTDEAEEIGIKAEVNLPTYYFQKAENLNKAKDYPATLKALEATVAAAEKYKNAGVKEKAEKTIPQIYYAMGVADFQAQKFNEAIKNLDQAIALDPGNVGAYFVRGVCFQQLKDEAKMEESYRLAIEKGTANGDATNAQKAKAQLVAYFNQAGSAAQGAKKWDDAIAAFSKTLEVDNQNSTAYYSLSVCYNEKKNWDNVISNLDKALEFRTDKDRWTLDGANFYLGTAYAGKKENDKACECFKKVGEGNFQASAKYQIETVLKCK